MTKPKTRYELRQENRDAWKQYWATVAKIAPEDLEAWVKVPLPPPIDRDKKPRESDEPLMGQYCPRCEMRRFRCVCKPPCSSRGRSK